MATTTRPQTTRADTETVKETPAKAARNGRSNPMSAARTAVAGVVSDAVGTAGTIAAEASNRLPVAASTTVAAFDDANQRVRASSDEMLRLGTALSFGFAAGLLIAGANRVLITLAMVPLAMFGLTMLERSGAMDRGARSTAVPGGL